MIRVLVVDDSALMRRVLGGILGRAADMELAYARDGVEAIAQLHAFKPDVITLDVQMPQMDGLSCLDRIMVERPSRVVMVSSLTAQGADATLEAMQLGAVDFIAKPEGTISLAPEAFGDALMERVRAAAGTRLRPAARLTERVRLRTGLAAAARSATQPEPPLAQRPTQPGPMQPRPMQPRPMQPGQVVLVGTSTGGPPALDALLRPLPADFPWPILVAQHMPAAFTGPLARRLDRSCALHVVEAGQPVPIAAGHVYIGRGDADIIVGARPAGPVVMAAPSDPGHRWHPSVDRLVSTALDHIGAPHLVGVLMTGMGNDGATAMTCLRQGGGRTIAEAQETAVVWGMPGELVRAGGAERVARLEDIAGVLLDWAASPAVARAAG